MRRASAGSGLAEAGKGGTDREAVAAAFAEACAQAVHRARNPGKYGDVDDVSRWSAVGP
ncbi:hypothetical protein GCM10010266_38910 [Streptomyces griseomycini]|nr:hypothetical protein GCM10010266_38910 [Streptomyces griseomycini]